MNLLETQLPAFRQAVSTAKAAQMTALSAGTTPSDTYICTL
jgi:hypothetical protein